MKFSTAIVGVNQLDVKDVEAIERVQDMLRQVSEHYGDKRVLMSPNTGELVQTKELSRTLGILDFFLCNRVVEVQTDE